MCGIFGIIGAYDASQARSALSLLSHRGRDFCGIKEQKGLFFAHQRLSIQNLHADAHQPLEYQGILLSFNGAIYNTTELQQILAPHFRFRIHSEAEVLMASYLHWGLDFVKHLRGMFAIAIYDKEKLYLFRDRLGKKPLFYMQGSSFYFASEIKALTPFLKHTRMNEEALMGYLSFLAPHAPHTFYEGIQKLAPSQYLVFSQGTLSVHSYENILDISMPIISSKEEAIYSLEKLLDESISLRLHADVPMASLLSGGIDSATINAYASKHAKKLQTYTLGYKEYAKYDETANAKESASILGLQNKAVLISQEDFLDASDKALDMLDEPLNDPAAIPLYLLFETIAKDGYKVVLSGEGSDELFLGYKQYFEYLDIEEASKLKHKNWLKNYFKANYSQHREWEYYKRIFNDTLLFRSSGESFTDLQKNALLKRNVKDNDSLKYLQKHRDAFENSSHTDPSLWYTYRDLMHYQGEHYLTKLDRMSMAHTIESRTPFLDHKLVQQLFHIAPHLRYEDAKVKALLKSIVAPLVDERILQRKKKGFANPYYEYLRNSGKLSLIEKVNTQTGLFKSKELQDFLAPTKNASFKKHIWGLYVLSVWIDKKLL